MRVFCVVVFLCVTSKTIKKKETEQQRDNEKGKERVAQKG